MNIAVIFAGGVGVRMNSNGIPKQFLKVNGVPIIIHTLQNFQDSKSIDKIVISCVPEYIDHLQNLIEQYKITKVEKIVAGGSTGQESIYNGLLAAKEISRENSIVLTHDGVRPLIDDDLIYRNVESVKKHGSAISSVLSKETIAIADSEGRIKETTNRERSFLARSPQSFYLNDILECHEKAIKDGKQFIDSSSLMLHYGKVLYMVETSYENIKITTPDDYYIFKALLAAKENMQILGV